MKSLRLLFVFAIFTLLSGTVCCSPAEDKIDPVAGVEEDESSGTIIDRTVAGEVPDPGDTLSILFIGNSFTQRDDMTLVFKALAQEGVPGVYLDVHKRTYGGRNLEQHWDLGTQHIVRRAGLTIAEQEALITKLEGYVAKFEDGYYRNALNAHRELLNSIRNKEKFRKWDIVVLQSWRDDLSGKDSGYITWAKKFAEVAQGGGARVVLYETCPNMTNEPVWGRLNQVPVDGTPSGPQIETAREKLKMIAGLSAELNAGVLPMTAIVMRSQTGYPARTLRYVNDIHPNQTCTYLTACAFYGLLFGKSPEGLTLDSVTTTATLNGKPDKDQDGNPKTVYFNETVRRELQKTAWEGLSDYKTMIE